jgi:hypothetical protein
MKRVRRPWAPALGGIALALAVALAGCAAPQYTYVGNTSQNTYFKVPYSWSAIKSTALVKALTNGGTASSGVWTAGFDASSRPSPEHVLGLVPAQPFVYATITQLNATTSNELSYNLLRDFFLPVTASTRQTADGNGFPLTGFRLLSDAIVTPGQGIHGVHETFDYTYPGGTVVTFDQIAMTNADATVVYLLVVHCTAACYRSDQAAINTVMDSFIVRSSS